MTAAAASSALATPKSGSDRSHEPSMEEILASIRRIIAEDQPHGAAAPAVVASAPIVEQKIVRPEPVVRTPSPTAAELDSAVERLRRALEPIVEKTSRIDPAPKTGTAEPPPVAKVEPVAEPQPAPVVIEEKPVAAAAAPAESLMPPPPPPEAEIPAEPVAAAVVEYDPEPQPVIAPQVEPLRPKSPFPSLEKAFPGSAPVLQRVASELPVDALRAPAPSQPLSRAEVLSQFSHADEPVAMSQPTPDALLSPSADASVMSSFQALATSVLFQDKAMVEEMAKEMLRPMLKQWLDDNLPVMVERLVRSEIERVARGGR